MATKNQFNLQTINFISYNRTGKLAKNSSNKYGALSSKLHLSGRMDTKITYSLKQACSEN